MSVMYIYDSSWVHSPGEDFFIILFLTISHDCYIILWLDFCFILQQVD